MERGGRKRENIEAIIGEQLLYAYDAPGSNFPIKLHDEVWRGEVTRSDARQGERERDTMTEICKVRTSERNERYEGGSLKTRSDK